MSGVWYIERVRHDAPVVPTSQPNRPPKQFGVMNKSELPSFFYITQLAVKQIQTQKKRGSVALTAAPRLGG